MSRRIAPLVLLACVVLVAAGSVLLEPRRAAPTQADPSASLPGAISRAPVAQSSPARDTWIPTGGSLDPNLLGGIDLVRQPIGPPVELGPTPPATPLEFSLVLRVAKPGDLEAYLASLYDPKSPNFHRFLSAREFGERFGLTPERIERLVAWAQATGFQVTGQWAQRTVLGLRGTAGDVNRVFQIALRDVRDARTGDVYHQYDGEATIPAAISADVDGIAGLVLPPPMSRRVEGAVLPGGPRAVAGPFGPVELAKAYDIEPLYEAGLTGAGQTVAVMSFDTYLDEDLATFERELGIQGPAIIRVPVDGGVSEPGEGRGEVTLDLETIRAVAPGAQLLNFELARFDPSGIVDAIVQDGRATVISNSWGVCEDILPDAERARSERTFQAMAAAGITMYVASGDWGAFDCYHLDPANHQVSVDWPSNSAFTTPVGGTYLSVREDGTYYEEYGWEDWLSTGGTGGGTSKTIPRPAWQVGLGVINEWSDGNRQIPDVAATSDPDTGYLVYETNEAGEGEWKAVGGTSGAAPFWSAITMLFAEAAQRSNLGPLGFVNPMLYDIANSAAPDTVFHDVVRGGDLLHRATTGWDYATGLGTPDVTALAAAIVEYLRANAGS